MPEKMEGRRLGKFISEVGKLEGNEGQRWKFQSKEVMTWLRASKGFYWCRDWEDKSLHLGEELAGFARTFRGVWFCIISGI